MFQRQFSLMAVALTALATSAAHADEPTWSVKLSTTPNAEVATGVAVDRDRNVYTVGTTGGLLFATSNTGYDAWITKHDAAGAVKWSKQMSTEDAPVGVAVIPSFGPVMLGSDGASPYVAKYSMLNGSREWKTTLPGGGTRNPVAIAAGEGDWYTYAVGGGAGHVGEPRLGAKDGWIVKLDGSGNVVWKRHVGTAENDQIDAVAFDGGTGVYVAGQTWGTDTEYIAGSGNIWVRHAWVVKLDKDGNFLWKQTIDGGRAFSERAVAVAASATGVYLVGLTSGSVGAGASYGGDDVWIARYNQNGQRSWLSQIGTTANDKAEGAVVDANGNLLLAGTSTGNMAGGNAGSTDAWLRKYSSAGVLLWKRWLGTISPDTCHGVAVDAKGGVILVGDSQGAIGGASSGTTDAYVAKFDQPKVRMVIDPAYRTVKRGGYSTQYPIVIDRNDFTGSVDLALGGDTTGLTCSFSNDPTTLASSALNCWTQSGTTLGIHNLQVTATATGVTIAPVDLQANITTDGGVTMGLASTKALDRGQSTTVTVTLTRTNFPDPVSMSVIGLPAGMTASWNPQTVGTSATTTTLTLQTAADMLPGVYPLTVRGTAAGVTIPNKTLTVTVNAPPQVRLYAAQNARTINAGQSATYTVDLIRTAFSGSVTLGTSTLPAGVSASFSPSPATGDTATLTVTTTSTAAGGPLNFYVTGSASGVTIERLPLTLNVIAPSSVVLSASPTTRTITAGQSTTFPITLTRSNFTGAVTLAVSGTNSTIVTGTFSPTAPTGGSSTLSVATSTGAAGTHTLTISGTASGVAILPITVTLIVIAPTGVTLTANATQPTIVQTQTASYTVTINRSNFTGAVTLAAAGVPSGASITFTPNGTTGNSVAISIATTSQTETATNKYITISGTASGVTIAPITIPITVNALRIVAQAHKKCKNGTNAEFTLDYLQPDGTYVPNAATGPYHFTLAGNANLTTRWSANWYQCATSNWTPTDRPWYVRTYQTTTSPGTSLTVHSAGVNVYDSPLTLNAGHWEINLAETTTLPGDYYVLAP